MWPGPNLQALAGPLWTRERGTLHSCSCGPLWGASRPGTGVHGGAGRGESDGQIRCGPGEPKSMLVGPELKALRSPDKRCCKLKWLSLKPGCSGVCPFHSRSSTCFLPSSGGHSGGHGKEGRGGQERRNWRWGSNGHRLAVPCG